MITVYNRTAESTFTLTGITWNLFADTHGVFTPTEATVRLDLDTHRWLVKLEGPAAFKPLESRQAVMRGDDWRELSGLNREDALDGTVRDLLAATVTGHSLAL